MLSVVAEFGEDEETKASPKMEPDNSSVTPIVNAQPACLQGYTVDLNTQDIRNSQHHFTKSTPRRVLVGHVLGVASFADNGRECSEVGGKSSGLLSHGRE